jgi:hypothetical protein
MVVIVVIMTTPCSASVNQCWQLGASINACTHARAHKHKRIKTHPLTHIHVHTTHSHSHSLTHSFTHSLTHSLTLTLALTSTHSRAHREIRMFCCSHVHSFHFIHLKIKDCTRPHSLRAYVASRSKMIKFTNSPTLEFCTAALLLFSMHICRNL